MTKSALEIHEYLSAEEYAMRRALGLDNESKPLAPREKADKTRMRQQMEVELICYTPSGRQIVFYHPTQTVSALLAECEARKAARKRHLDIVSTKSVLLKEYAYSAGLNRH